MTPYKAVKIGGAKRDQHRVIMEELLGRRLRTDEVVHHIDGDKRNNAPENLMVMSLADHSRLHQKGRKLPVKVRQKLSAAHKGKANVPCRKLSKDQVISILQMLDQRIPTRHIADMLGIKRSAVTGIRYGKTYQDWTEEYEKKKGA